MHRRILPLLALVVMSFCMACGKSAEAPTPAASPAIIPSSKARPTVPPGAQEVTPDSGKGSLRLPGPGEEATGETHNRHRYELPAGATNVLAEVRWTDKTWDNVKLALGTGICPHRGKKLAEITATSGSGIVEVLGAELDPQSAEPRFLHVNADALSESKAGQTLDYTFHIFSW